MAMQTDVKATKPLTATGAFKDQNNSSITARTRLKGAYIMCGASAGSVVITSGSGGETLLSIDTPTVANSGAYTMYIPGEGILAPTGLYGTVTNAASIVLFYG